MFHQAADRSTPFPAALADERQPWAVLLLVSVAQFMVILDVTVVNVALPTIGRGLGFAPQDLQWVVTTYVLMTGGLLLLGGRMSDLLGRRPLFLAGLILFSCASLVSGLAGTPAALIASRAGQGLGAAMLSPAALSIVTTTYTGAQRTAALSVWGAIGGGGGAAGVLLGGAITSTFGWRWIFFINVPIGLVAAALALRFVSGRQERTGSLPQLDLPGALTLVGGLLALLYAIEGATTHGWVSPLTLGLLALSGGLLAAFAAIERRAKRPLVPPTTWKLRTLVSSAAVMLGVTGILVGTFFLNSLFLQNVLKASAMKTGLAFLPVLAMTGIAAHFGPRLLVRFGARIVVVAGLVLIACGNLLLTRAQADASYPIDLLPGFLLLGFGVGLTFVAISVTAMAEIEAERAGLASGLMTTAHELGGAFGVSLFSAVAIMASAAGGAGFTRGYDKSALAGALIAGALAVISMLDVPAFRPEPTSRAASH